MVGIIGMTAMDELERPSLHVNVLRRGRQSECLAYSALPHVVIGTNGKPFGFSVSIPEARKVALDHWVDIGRCLVMPKQASFKIDWGGVRRGQGRRSGGMVKGSMSSPLYVREYQYLDLSEYVDDLRSEITARASKHMTTREEMLYYSARKYGLNNIEAMALCLNFDKWDSDND